MTTHHYTEEVLQQFALEGIAGDQQLAQHLEQCAACRAVVEEYRLLFTEIRHLPKPSLEMNLEALVLQQLPVPVRKKQTSYARPLMGAIGVIVLLLAGIPLLLFEYKLAGYWNNISLMVLGAIIIVTLIITILHVHDIFLRFYRKMQVLN